MGSQDVDLKKNGGESGCSICASLTLQKMGKISKKKISHVMKHGFVE